MKPLLLIFALIAGFSVFEPCFAQKNTNDDVYDSGKDTTKKSSGGFDGLFDRHLVDDHSYDIEDFSAGYVIMPDNSLKYGEIRFNGNKVILLDSITQKTTRFGSDEVLGFVAKPIADSARKWWHIKWGYQSNFSFLQSKKVVINPKYNVHYMESDTFTVYTNSFVVHPAGHTASFGDKTVTDRFFLKLAIWGPKASLYKRVQKIMGTTSNLMGMPGGFGSGVPGTYYFKNTFYLIKPGEHQYTEVPRGGGAFRKLMSVYFKDDPTLVSDIEQKNISYEKIDDMVLQYNTDK